MPHCRAQRILHLAIVIAGRAGAAAADDLSLADELRRLDTRVLTQRDGESPRDMVARDIRARRRAANQQSSGQWRTIGNRQEWEAFRKPRLEALRQSLGTFPTPGADLKSRVTGRLAGDGYRIENLVFEGRPGLWVTANQWRDRLGRCGPTRWGCRYTQRGATRSESMA